MRLTGALLITAAGLLAGLRAAGGLRAAALRRDSLCKMLALLEFELGRFHTPLPEMFADLAARTDGAGASLCRRMTTGLTGLGEQALGEIWLYALEELPARERDILRPLGQVLGRYGAQEQLQALTLCRRDMEQARDEARTKARERSSIYAGLAASAGAVCAVLLL